MDEYTRDFIKIGCLSALTVFVLTLFGMFCVFILHLLYNYLLT